MAIYEVDRIPYGWRVTVGPLHLDAESPHFDRGAIRAAVSVHTDAIIYHRDTLNLTSARVRATLMRLLASKGLDVDERALLALEEACRMLPELEPCRDAYHAAEGADALVIMTEWNVFRNLDFEKLRTMVRSPLVLDLRNVYDPGRVTAAGFKHVSVGRPSRSPKDKS